MCVKNVATRPPSYLILQFISVSNSLHSPHYHFIPSPLHPITTSSHHHSLHPLSLHHHSPHPIHPIITLSHHHSLHPLSLHRTSSHHYSPITIRPHPISTSLHHHSPISTPPFHLITPPPPHTHSLTGGSGVCCGVLSPLREGPDQRSQEENQHHPHHRGCQTPAQVQDAGR